MSNNNYGNEIININRQERPYSRMLRNYINLWEFVFSRLKFIFLSRGKYSRMIPYIIIPYFLIVCLVDDLSSCLCVLIARTKKATIG